MSLAVVQLMRPKQWTKNLLIFAALIFTKSYADSRLLVLSALAFAAMCFASSAVYALNDVIDAERDRNHPRKKLRPIASGALSPRVGVLVGLICLVLAIGLSVAVGVSPLSIPMERGLGGEVRPVVTDFSFAFGVGVYLLIQLGYTFGLKAVPILDIFIVATGFVLRAALGAVAIGVGISGWLLLCTGLLALMLGFAKRRHEFISQGDERGQSRPSLLGYTRSALDALVIFASAGAALSYGVYAIESDTAKHYPALVLTVPVVLYGVMRYLFLVFGREEGGEPENLVFGDLHMILVVFAFLGLALLALSGFKVGFIGT
ncbi:MAG: UbiA prenyltransferase family protein [Fimbriimonadaceae bacterium]|nr:UbiA prenyltransferase family protein [Fimbriimonadaceae bacterium]